MEAAPKETLFPDIDADNETGVTIIESFCVSCEEQVSARWGVGGLYIRLLDCRSPKL